MPSRWSPGDLRPVRPGGHGGRAVPVRHHRVRRRDRRLVGGELASRISSRIGSGPSLALAISGMGIISILIGALPYWPVVLVLFGLNSLFVILWNVITVSLRQTIIPSRLLGRVNSVYRFFAWGMIPIGAIAGGLLVAGVEAVADRDWALRSTYFAVGVAYVPILVVARAKLTTAEIESARAAATPPSTS